MKSLITKVYIISLMAASLFFMFLIYKLTFAHLFEIEDIEHTGPVEAVEKIKVEEENLFEKMILESEDKVRRYLGYRVLVEQRIKGHFHHIGFEVGPDNRSYCITCHGDMPHDEVKEVRAFLNMHAFFIACETCHTRLPENQRTGVFKWYDRRTGKIVDSPVLISKPGAYNAKIIPFEMVDYELKRMDSDERIAFARRYLEMEKTLTPAQKSRSKKIIHKRHNKKPILCEECHNKETPFLPFKKLGYPQERIDSIISTEVVGMVKKYSKFYMPKLLEPGIGGKDSKS